VIELTHIADHVKLGAIQFGLWELGVSTSQGNLGFLLWKNLGFLIGTKLGVSGRLSCNKGMCLGRDL
jgi:hypothetical protein